MNEALMKMKTTAYKQCIQQKVNMWERSSNTWKVGADVLKFDLREGLKELHPNKFYVLETVLVEYKKYLQQDIFSVEDRDDIDQLDELLSENEAKFLQLLDGLKRLLDAREI